MRSCEDVEVRKAAYIVLHVYYSAYCRSILLTGSDCREF